jgi:hypothetical protein
MPDTLLASLSSTLRLTTRQEIARSLGESEQAVSRGLQFATRPRPAGHRTAVSRCWLRKSELDRKFFHLEASYG